MRKPAVLFSMLFIGLFTLIVEAQKSDVKTSSQPDLASDQAMRDFERADKKLNIAYKMLMEFCGGNEDANKELMNAQLAWIKYRDLEALSASRNPLGYTKLSAVIRNKTSLTMERTDRLKQRLEGLLQVLDKEQRINKRHDNRTDRLEEMIKALNKLDDDEKKDVQ